MNTINKEPITVNNCRACYKHQQNNKRTHDMLVRRNITFNIVPAQQCQICQGKI